MVIEYKSADGVSVWSTACIGHGVMSKLFMLICLQEARSNRKVGQWLVISRFLIVFVMYWEWMSYMQNDFFRVYSPSEYRRRSAIISPKCQWSIAEMSMEYRRNVNGISPKEQRFFIEEGMAMRLFGGFSSVLIIFYCWKVLISDWPFVNYLLIIPIFFHYSSVQ